MLEFSFFKVAKGSGRMETNQGLGANTNGLSEIIHPAHTKEQRVWLLAFDELNQSMSIGLVQ